MATLILTAVGTAVGGPIGGAIGAIVGQSVDRTLFAPKARHGPRLGDLAVQTSSYGTAIPKIFGTMRVAGTVIWATDIIETKSTSGGGKGKPKTVGYSYSASFAVALSGRGVRTVRRIWADGKLLRGVAGDFKSETRFRLYPGDEDQEPDPLIASAEGAGETTAFRGTAYAVFEDFQLEDYGNRIPSLTFELEADAGPVSIGAIAEELSAGIVQAGATPEVGGYAASGDSVRGAIEALSDVVPLSLTDQGDALLIEMDSSIATFIPDDAESKDREITRRAGGSVPAEVTVAYYDVGRDYLTGLQRAFRGDGQPRISDRRALPAALSAEAAKGFAEFRLAHLWTGRTSAKLRLGWKYCFLKPGAHLRLENESGLWKVERTTIGPMTVSFQLRRAAEASSAPSAAASPGRPVVQPDLIHGPTTLRLHDLPIEGNATKPVLIALAAGEEAGWRRAALMASYDVGASWQEAGSTAAPAVIGTAVTALADGGSTLFDDGASVEVELLNIGMLLENRSDEALIGGANLALLGRELFQFGRAEAIGGRRFRLSRLLRGRRGTEWAASAHSAGEDFALIEPNSLLAIEAPAGSIGGEARLMASGIGDSTEAVAAIEIEGETLRPPSPVHLHAVRTPSDDLSISWTRRSRQGWSWLSGSDTPLGEETEAYRLTISGLGSSRTILLDQGSYFYPATEQAADGNDGQLSLSVIQIGTFAASRPAVLSIG